jgi:hypothetical protein
VILNLSFPTLGKVFTECPKKVFGKEPFATLGKELMSGSDGGQFVRPLWTVRVAKVGTRGRRSRGASLRPLYSLNSTRDVRVYVLTLHQT